MRILHYTATVTVPVVQHFRTPDGVVGSHRVALFRVTGRRGQRAIVQVMLRLPHARERCVSCRLVHFFVRVQ
jgi:hypothetical protein